MKKETVLITGLTGRSGKYFAQRIMRENPENYAFTIIVRSSSNTENLDQSTVNFNKLIGDLDDTAFLDKACQNVDVVFHIAGITKSLPLVQAAVKNDVKRIILVHTTGIYSQYKSASKEYIRIEKEISELLINTEISLTILRPTMIYGTLDDGNISQFIRMVDKLPIFPVVKEGKFALQPVHHQDLGNAYYQVLVNPDSTKNKNYDLSGKYPIDLIDILKTIKQYLNKSNRFISVPFWFAYSLAWILFIVSFTKKDYREKVQRLVEPRAYPHTQAVKDFGYNPVDFKDGLKEEVNAYLSRKKMRK